jgi:hypothetical protein
MKTQHSNRMPKTKTSQKETGDGGDKAPGRKQPVRKNNVKKSGAHHDDDDSVDSRGNIRGLIVSDSEDSSSEPETDDSTYSRAAHRDSPTGSQGSSEGSSSYPA